ncbi:MAG: hypothetical protein ACFFEK_06320 [Candidatus Thorarchaeota archaeon]
MTEIPMPGPDPYQQQPKKSSTGSDCCKWGAIICVILIITMVVIAMLWMGSILTWFSGFGGGGTTYDTRSIASYNDQDVQLYSNYYYDEFDVFSSETTTTTAPDLQFDISVVSTGSDGVVVTIHFAIYEIDQATFDSIPTWGGVAPYLVDSGNYTTNASDFYNLNNYADTYVWVLWFDASSKTDVWSVNIDLTLRYNWNL